MKCYFDLYQLFHYYFMELFPALGAPWRNALLNCPWWISTYTKAGYWYGNFGMITAMVLMTLNRLISVVWPLRCSWVVSFIKRKFIKFYFEKFFENKLQLNA